MPSLPYPHRLLFLAQQNDRPTMSSTLPLQPSRTIWIVTWLELVIPQNPPSSEPELRGFQAAFDNEQTARACALEIVGNPAGTMEGIEVEGIPIWETVEQWGIWGGVP